APRTCRSWPASTRARCRRTGSANSASAASPSSATSCATTPATCCATTARAALSTEGLLAYCRAGFEPELAADLAEKAAEAGLHGYARTDRDSGYVQVLGVEDAAALTRALPWRQLIFARQKLRLLADLPGLDPRDRIAPVQEALSGRGRFGELWVEHPDTDTGKPLAGLA